MLQPFMTDGFAFFFMYCLLVSFDRFELQEWLVTNVSLWRKDVEPNQRLYESRRIVVNLIRNSRNWIITSLYIKTHDEIREL